MAIRQGDERVLTPEAVAVAAELEREFGAQRRRLLARRDAIQQRLDAGWRPDFLPQTREIRAADWRVAAVPCDLADRRVEITGPTGREMVMLLIQTCHRRGIHAMGGMAAQIPIRDHPAAHAAGPL